ncbi:MAG: metallophosphatase domain-containing protein [Bacteroidota bacterium]
MKIVAISDTHGLHRELVLPKGDVIIHAGDFCDIGNEQHIFDFLTWFGELDFAHKIFIGGNHDFFAAEHPEEFASIIPKGITYLNDSGIIINGVRFWGSPVKPDLVGWAFGKLRGTLMNEHWNHIPNQIDILITHTPPYGILDKPRSGISIGCEELSKRLKLLQPRLHIFGHVHASYGQFSKDGTLYMNASNIHSEKGLVNLPIVFFCNFLNFSLQIINSIACNLRVLIS